MHEASFRIDHVTPLTVTFPPESRYTREEDTAAVAAAVKLGSVLATLQDGQGSPCLPCVPHP